MEFNRWFTGEGLNCSLTLESKVPKKKLISDKYLYAFLFFFIISVCINNNPIKYIF